MRKRWTTLEQFRLSEMRKSGRSIPACALSLGRTVGSVSGQLVRMGLTKKALPSRRKPGELSKVLWRIVSRCGVAHAADSLGISRQCVYTLLRRKGIYPPYRRSSLCPVAK